MGECMEKLEQSDDTAVAISRYYIRDSLYRRSAYCFRDSANIRSNLVMLKMRETGIRHGEWNRMIQRISEAGLIAKWSRIVGTSTKNSNEMDLGAGLMKMEHLIGILGCFVACWILAFFVAFLEYIIDYKMKRPNHHRLWNLADMLIDGRRHLFTFNRNNNINRRRAAITRNRNR